MSEPMNTYGSIAQARSEALEEAERVLSAIEGVELLLVPEPELSAHARDKISILVGLLHERSRAALERLRALV